MKYTFLASIAIISMMSCGNKDAKKNEITLTDSQTEVVEISRGEKLFNENACSSCHQLNETSVGPSVKEIAKIYKEKKGNLNNFLKGKEKPIVLNDAGQIGIMKANLDGIVKEISDADLKEIISYIQNN